MENESEPREQFDGVWVVGKVVDRVEGIVAVLEDGGLTIAPLFVDSSARLEGCGFGALEQAGDFGLRLLGVNIPRGTTAFEVGVQEGI